MHTKLIKDLTLTDCCSSFIFRDEYGQNMTKYVDLSSIQTITGKKTFQEGLDIGDNIYDVGNNCFAVGTDLTVGSYNFYYKGVDIDKDALSGRVYLCAEQPRYPYPFCIENGDKTKFRMIKKVIDVNVQSSLSNMYHNTILSGLWFLSAQDGSAPPHRDDYNQLCIDLGDNYWSDTESTIDKVKEYIDDAFTEETSLSIYNLSGNLEPGVVITMVNNDKIAYLRCGTVIGFGNGYIDVQFTDTAINSSRGFGNDGIGHNDLDWDDASLVFIDYPTLSGPANASTYSSLNVGAENTVLRRCSMAVGKQNKTESDFCIALGRKAEANHYNSFVWAPAKTIKSPKSSTFTIGLNDTISNCKSKTSTARTIYVADKNGNSEELHSFIWGCLSSNPSMLSSFFVNNKTSIKNWLGI